MAIHTENGGRWRGSNRRIAAWAVVTLLLLLIPVIGMQVADGWNWGPFDFVFGFVVIFGAGLTFELLARKADTLAYRAGVGVAVAAGLVLVWINAAAGIIGEDNGTNMIYFGVLLIGLAGAFIGRFTPKGMARAAFAAAIAQLLVPLIVAAIPNLRGALMEPPGLLGVLTLNTFFAILFAASALCFRRAALSH